MEHEFDWDLLIDCIDDGRVMPVLGQELLQSDVGGKRQSLQRLLVERLAEKLKLNVELNPFCELNDLVCAYLEQPRTRLADLYPLIAKAAKELAPDVAVPESLLKLARIPKFDYFVSLTFDSLMARALDTVRFGGQAGTREVAFSINQSTAQQDEAQRRPPASTPVVYNLFGRASSSADYAIHDEDVLEFIHRLVSRDVTPPEWLLSELRGRHLLILGVHLPDWLGRFVLRAATRDRLLLAQRSYFIAREGAASARTLDEFLRRFGRETHIQVYDAPVSEFVDELYRRWTERFGTEELKPVSDSPAGKCEIFISYGRENLPAVEVLHRAIEDLGGVAWFDKDELTIGERWEKTIVPKIKRDARLFIPVVSTKTVERAATQSEGYVFKEWRYACDRAESIVGRRKFIFPVVVDAEFDGGLGPYQTLLDDFPSLSDYNFGHAPVGVPTEKLRTDLREAIRAMERAREVVR